MHYIPANICGKRAVAEARLGRPQLSFEGHERQFGLPQSNAEQRQPSEASQDAGTDRTSQSRMRTSLKLGLAEWTASHVGPRTCAASPNKMHYTRGPTPNERTHRYNHCTVRAKDEDWATRRTDPHWEALYKNGRRGYFERKPTQ